jgi:peptide/nickel transport system substrate-binding protein
MVSRRQVVGGLAGAAAVSVLPLGTFGLTGPARAQTAIAPGGTLNIGLHIPLSTLDWQSTVSHPLPHVMGHVFEGLYGFGKDFNAAPELAESVEATPDGLKWTFKLRSGVKFHNGDVMDAGDVKASIERWRTVGPKGPGLAALTSIETPSDDTVVLNFGTPMGRFLLLMMGSDENKCVIMPKEIAEASTTPGQLTEVIGTGPYKFVEYNEDQYVKLEKFADYVARDDAPNYQAGKKVANVDTIIFWIVSEATTRIAGLESGEYDIITEVPDTEYKRLSESADVDAIKNGPGVLMYMMFNHKKGPTANILIRKAIQSIVNPIEIASVAVADPAFALANPSLYAPESAFNTDAGSDLFKPGDIEMAKKYLAEAGYAGEPITIQVISGNDLQEKVAVVLVEQASRAGLNLEIGTYDLNTWVARRRDPDALNIYTSGGYWVDPSLWHAEFNGTFPSPEVGFISDETEKIFAALAAATEFEERRKLGEDLQRSFFAQVALVNLGYTYRLVAKRKNVLDPDGNLALGNLTLNGVGFAS